jgi:plasmid stability protein
MPTVILDNVPPEVYQRLQRRAAARQRTVPEELLEVLRNALQQEADAFPPPEVIPSQEISAPFDLPMPGPGVRVKARPGEPPPPDLVGFEPE